MPSYVPGSPPNALGYKSYGMPQNVQTVGRGGPAYNVGGRGIGTAGTINALLSPPQAVAPTVGRPKRLPHVPQPYPQKVASGKGPRWKWGIFPGVAASNQTSSNFSTARQRAVNMPPTAAVQGAFPQNPLFGRPGFTYQFSKPASRVGPGFKGAPGTGGRDPLTGLPARQGNRSTGFVPGGYAQEQYQDVHQFDYTPPTDASVDLGEMDAGKFQTIPRSIMAGADGLLALNPTYRAHDFTPADRFFKAGRSASNWQDMSFGPFFRYLQPQQQVARYNLYTDIALARYPSQNAYFLPYQTQPATISQLTGMTGMGAPLGYASH